MTKLFKSKMITAGMITALVGMTLLMAGLTLAWWNSEDSSVYANVIRMDPLHGDNDVRINTDPHIYNTKVINSSMNPWYDNAAAIRYVGEYDYVVVSMKFTDGEIRRPENNNPFDPQAGWEPMPPGFYKTRFQTEGSIDSVIINTPLWDDVEYDAYPMGIWTLEGSDVMYIWGEKDDKVYVGIHGLKSNQHWLNFAWSFQLLDNAKIHDYPQGSEIRWQIEWEILSVPVVNPGQTFLDALKLKHSDVDWFEDVEVIVPADWFNRRPIMVGPFEGGIIAQTNSVDPVETIDTVDDPDDDLDPVDSIDLFQQSE